MAERGFDPRTSWLLAQRASSAPLWSDEKYDIHVVAILFIRTVAQWKRAVPIIQKSLDQASTVDHASTAQLCSDERNYIQSILKFK